MQSCVDLFDICTWIKILAWYILLIDTLRFTFINYKVWKQARQLIRLITTLVVLVSSLFWSLVSLDSR